MTLQLPAIKRMYDEAPEGTSHVLIVFDAFDESYYPVYVPEGDDPQEHRPKSSMDRVKECYRLSLGWDLQAAEVRAQHWEFDPKEKTA